MTERLSSWMAFALSLLLTGSGLSPARADVVVGGKDFTEQRLAAEMTTQLLSRRGYQVIQRTGFSSAGLRREQELGLIDVCWEYTGTSLKIFNKIADKLDPEQTYDRVKELDAAKGLVWLSPSHINDTYALAMRKADAVARGVNTISDLAQQVRSRPKIKFGSNAEFFFRSDGLRPLQRAYDFEFGPDNVVRMDRDAVYEALRSASGIDVGLVFSTDGRVAAYDLMLLRDDRGFFPSYLLAPVVRRSSLRRNPDCEGQLDALSSKLDDATIAGLNAKVDIEKLTIEEVAATFLKHSGLVASEASP